MNEDFFQLEKKRTDAKITQAEMASYLGVSQSQVSRYEQDPDSVPGGILLKWNQICGEMAGAKGLEFENPRVELTERLKLITEYAKVSPIGESELVNKAPAQVDSFLLNIKTVAKKPRVGVFGQFDAGKSRLINVLLGGNRLPTGYQPATSVVSLIRHINDKPSWQAEDVWIMSKGFDFDQADNEEHCLNHRMFAGGYESLAQYGTHSGSGSEHRAFAATVYVDSPLLLGAELIDLPGYGHSDDDKDRAEMAQKMVDVLIYASPTTGFLNQNDLLYLNILIRNLPNAESKGLPSLRNLFIVATHAHHVSSSDRINILEAAATRGYKHLDNVIAERIKASGKPISKADFHDRFFTFSADKVEIRERFENDLVELLAKAIPDSTLRHVQEHIIAAKAQAATDCDKWISKLQTALNERQKAQNEFLIIKGKEDERLRKTKAHEQKIEGMINLFANESKAYVGTVFEQRASVSAIESMIKSRYDDKKEAHQLAASYLVDSIQTTINDFAKVKANALGDEIEVFLDGYGPSIDKNSLLAGGWDFNPRVAFMSALSGLGTIGALAAWASIAAAGSNLGAYILIGQIVGWLSSIGISLGGAGSVMALVSSIGGPITLGIAAAVGVALAVFALFGDSWQTKLAKKIYENLAKQKAEKQMQEGVEKFWRDTKAAFRVAASATEKTYQSKLKSLQTLAFDTNPEELERELKFAKETRDFFAGMPWRVLPS